MSSDPQPQEDDSSYGVLFTISESLSDYDSDSDSDARSCISTDHLIERHQFCGEEGSSLGLSLRLVNDFDLNQEYLPDFMVDLRSEFDTETGTDLVPRADGLVAGIDRYDPYSSNPQNQNDARFPIAERILDSDSSSCITNEIDSIIDDSEILSSFVEFGAEVGVESGRNEARLGDGSGTMVAEFSDHVEPSNTPEDEEFE